MSTSSALLNVAGIDIDVIRKDIKNLHLGVYPPNGRVRVAAPPALDDDAVRLAVVARLPWIKRQRKQFEQQPRQPGREMVSGETHYLWGRKYRLRIVEDRGRQRVTFHGGRLELHVRPGADTDARARRLTGWYRDELKVAVADLVQRWSKVLGIDQPAWAVRRMKTKWGTCKPEQAKIWVNLELVKKAPACLEYIVVHELVHLLERNHTERFYSLMNKTMPHWRLHREALNQAPLANEAWSED